MRRPAVEVRKITVYSHHFGTSHLITFKLSIDVVSRHSSYALIIRFASNTLTRCSYARRGAVDTAAQSCTTRFVNLVCAFEVAVEILRSCLQHVRTHAYDVIGFELIQSEYIVRTFPHHLVQARFHPQFSLFGFIYLFSQPASQRQAAERRRRAPSPISFALTQQQFVTTE